MPLDFQEAGPPAWVAASVSGAITFFIFLVKSWIVKREKATQDAATVTRERLRLEGEANERLFTFMHEQIEEQNATIKNLSQKLDQHLDELAEMKLHEGDCQRELRSARAQIAALQQRVAALEKHTDRDTRENNR